MMELVLSRLGEKDASGERRKLGAGPIVLGRDASADWTIPAADKSVSRRHLEITSVGSSAHIKALGQNGFRIRKTNDLIAFGETAVLSDGDSIVVGGYELSLRTPPQELSGQHEHEPRTLFDAFLDGAGLGSAEFVIDSAPEVLRRAGKLYIAAVCGLCQLMKDRNKFKDRLAIDHTRISGYDNNPLRWGAPNRVAVELLQEAEPGFLEGDAALYASLRDIQNHMTSLTAGYRAVIDEMLRRLSPETVDARGANSIMLSGARKKWEAYEKAHAELSEEINQSLLGLSDAFASGYQDDGDGACRQSDIVR